MPRSYREALQAWQVAQNHFDHADPDHIDISILHLQAAEMRLAVELKRIREAGEGVA